MILLEKDWHISIWGNYMKLDIQLFASGSVTINGTLSGAGGSYAKFYAVRSYTQDLDEVTTTEIITIYLQRLSSYVSSYQNSAPLVVKANGVNIFSGNVSFNLGSITVGSSVKLTEFSRLLHHDSDGKYADYTLSATLTTGTGIGNGNLSGKITTPTIQTSFNVASSNFNIGNTVPINVGVNNVNYTYTLRYEIGTRTGTIATNQTNGSYVWTMGDDLINQIKIDNPKTKTVKVKIYCDTYNGETLKGTKNTTVDGTIVDIPELDVPTRVEQVAKILALTNSQYVVKDVSKFKFTFGTTAPIGTTIAKYVVYIGDRTIESTTNEFIVENIIENADGNTTFATQRIDARGNPSEIILETVPFIDYTKCEYISTTSTIERDNLTSIVANLKANWYNGQIGTTQNVLTLAYKYKEKTASTYTTGSTTITSSDLGVDKVLETLDNTKVYDFVFTIEDLIYTGGEMSKPLPSSEYVMCEYENGVDFKNAWIKGKQVVTTDELPIKNYSLEEQEIGTWIDGKKLYMKTIIAEVAKNTTVTVDLKNLNYHEIWIDYGKSFNHYGAQAATPINTSSGVSWYSSSSDYGIAYVNYLKILNIKNGSASPRTYYITLNYTKNDK